MNIIFFKMGYANSIVIFLLIYLMFESQFERWCILSLIPCRVAFTETSGDHSEIWSVFICYIEKRQFNTSSIHRTKSETVVTTKDHALSSKGGTVSFNYLNCSTRLHALGTPRQVKNILATNIPIDSMYLLVGCTCRRTCLKDDVAEKMIHTNFFLETLECMAVWCGGWCPV